MTESENSSLKSVALAYNNTKTKYLTKYSHGRESSWNENTRKTIVKSMVKYKYIKKRWWSEQMQSVMKTPENKNQWWNENICRNSDEKP